MYRKFLAGTAAIVIAIPALAATPTPAEFVEKAGASDTFEIDSAKLMVASKNPVVSKFAKQMVAAHTKSSKTVMAAARSDSLPFKAPSMTIGQRTDLTALKAVPVGKTKDELYVKQQRAAHADALSLMKGYAASGTAPHLKSAATEIAPVVEMHASMLKGL